MKNIFNFKALAAFFIAAAFASCNNPKTDSAKTIPAASGNMLAVMHTVSDYNKFKEVFASKDSMIKASGLTYVAQGKGIDAPNMVMVAFTTNDVAKAKE